MVADPDSECAPPTPALTTNSPDLFDAIRERLTDRQREVFFFRFVAEKSVSTISAILRVSVSTVEKELKTIRKIRTELCAGSIEEASWREVRIPISRGHRLALGGNRTLGAVITGIDRRRVSMR